MLISCFLTASTLAIGFKGLDKLKSVQEQQRCISSFNNLVESAKLVSLGDEGSAQTIDLDLPNGKISFKGRVIKLIINEEVIKSEILPFPANMDAQIESGSYTIELASVKDRFELILTKAVTLFYSR
ncbi:MAG: hypothetical protein ACP5KV_07405 [Candidatus Methanomethylicaceae archaeon]